MDIIYCSRVLRCYSGLVMTGLWDDFKSLVFTTLIVVVIFLGFIYGVLFLKKEDR